MEETWEHHYDLDTKDCELVCRPSDFCQDLELHDDRAIRCEREELKEI